MHQRWNNEYKHWFHDDFKTVDTEQMEVDMRHYASEITRLKHDLSRINKDESED
eukprot:CAMPEP_0201282798 /NCGR_PEP_ID=MMETSP1317-20130820/6724_1 /ASSEMBLY_ACC=CAM_ASM_000770 /TAXON_ID=187299 /ORGANISM="Undescribed Undescribed, Strain Undescribed" /LENGTH=53 /DNA_ID=CAMNT_0047596773 /DNA_START=2319 /DNA_END=2480 /DNA_ORIENTATION=+